MPNVILAVVLVGLNTAIAVWRWILLLKARGFAIPVGYGFSLYLIGMFFNYALPGSVSGDLVRGYYLVQDYPGRKMDSILSVLIDRILGLYSFFILTIIAVAADLSFVMAHENIRLVAGLTFLIFLGMTVFFVLCFSPAIYRLSHLDFLFRKIGILHRVMDGFQRFGENRRILILSVLVSLVGQFFCMFFFYEMGVLLHEPVSWKAVLFAVPMGFVVTAVPIAPAGVGVGQVAFLYLFQTYMNKTTAFGAVNASRLFNWTTAVWALIGVVFYLRRRKPHELDNLGAKLEAAGS